MNKIHRLEFVFWYCLEGWWFYFHIEFMWKRGSTFHMPETWLNLDRSNSLFWASVRSPVNQRPKSRIRNEGDCRLALWHPWSSVSQLARTSANSCLRVPYGFPRTFRVPFWCLESLHKLHWSLAALDTVADGGIWVPSAAACGACAELRRQASFEVIQSQILKRILDTKQPSFCRMLSFLFLIWPA